VYEGKGTMYNNWRYAYANGFNVLAEGLDMFRLGVIASGKNMNLSGNFVFYEKDFGWMDVWELNPEGCGYFG
jgi:hypothetical protein